MQMNVPDVLTRVNAVSTRHAAIGNRPRRLKLQSAIYISRKLLGCCNSETGLDLSTALFQCWLGCAGPIFIKSKVQGAGGCDPACVYIAISHILSDVDGASFEVLSAGSLSCGNLHSNDKDVASSVGGSCLIDWSSN